MRTFYTFASTSIFKHTQHHAHIQFCRYAVNFPVEIHSIEMKFPYQVLVRRCLVFCITFFCCCCCFISFRFVFFIIIQLRSALAIAMAMAPTHCDTSVSFYPLFDGLDIIIASFLSFHSVFICA